MIYKVTFYIVDSLFESFSTNWIEEVLLRERDCLVAAAPQTRSC